MSQRLKEESLSPIGCLLCDTLYDRTRATAGFTTCFECGVMLTKFARTERGRFYNLSPNTTPNTQPNREETTI